MPTRMATSGDERGTKRVRRTGASRTGPRRRCRPFSMLPDDLLVVIYRFLADYPSSRACFAAVCISWRTAVAAEPQVPVLPWLLLSPCDASYRARHAHCPQDGAALRFDVPRGAVGRRLVGGYDGGWVVSSQPAPLRIVNLFICAEVALSEKQRRITCPRCDHGRGDTRGPVVVSKIVFSEPPTSDTCIMAAITENCGIALCRVGCPDGGWTIHGCRVEEFIDIAFCKGKLYGLSRTHFDGEFVKFEIGVNKHGAPVVIAENRIALEMVTGQRKRWESSCKEYAGYIVDLNGRLMIAMITWWKLRHEPFFKVYELVDIHTHTRGAMTCNNYKWVEVTCLADHALFLGQTFSKVVHVSADMCGDIERNRIYYSKNKNGRPSLNAEVQGDAVFLMVSNNDNNLKHKKEDRTNAVDDDEMITSVEYLVKDGRHDSLWLLPPNI